MQIIVPCLYSEFGRFISRFRAIPFHIDCLIPVERRLLLTLNSLKSKKVKSARIVGDCMGNLHPHGDMSMYKSLTQLNERGFLETQGNWGNRGIIDSKPAAMRYTECKIKKSIADLCFKYVGKECNKWDNIEYADEPLVLPSPIPVGLLGQGITLGVAFHRTLIPRYTKESLLQRLIWLLRNDKNTNGPCIIPNIPDCIVKEGEPNALENILLYGEGRITIIPKGSIKDCNSKISPAKKYISVRGRAPRSSFKKLREAVESKKLPVTITGGEYSVDNELIKIIPKKKDVDIENLANIIWKKFLIKNANISVLVCNNDGKVVQKGIDDILMTGYMYWVYTSFLKNISIYEEQKKQLFEDIIVAKVRPIIREYDCKTTDDVIRNYKESLKYKNMDKDYIILKSYDINGKKWVDDKIPIELDDIRKIVSKKSIRNLIESELDIKKTIEKLNETKYTIDNIEDIRKNEVENMIGDRNGSMVC